jgi:thioredoxin 1
MPVRRPVAALAAEIISSFKRIPTISSTTLTEKSIADVSVLGLDPYIAQTRSARRRTMINRRLFALALAGSAFLSQTLTAEAFEIRPYDKAVVDKLIASGKPVVLHVYASWCLQCHMQASILDSLKTAGTYDKITFFRVDYDGQKDVVTALNCPRSTVIAYKGGKETTRMSWGTSEASVVDVLKTLL